MWKRAQVGRRRTRTFGPAEAHQSRRPWILEAMVRLNRWPRPRRRNRRGRENMFSSSNGVKTRGKKSMVL